MDTVSQLGRLAARQMIKLGLAPGFRMPAPKPTAPLKPPPDEMSAVMKSNSGSPPGPIIPSMLEGGVRGASDVIRRLLGRVSPNNW